MEELFSFEKLDVYRKALELAKKVNCVTRETSNNYHWSNQINRASTSISLNIAEGSGRTHTKEKRNFYYIARGSVFECIPLIDLGLSSGIIIDKQRIELRNDCLAIAKMLTKLIQNLKTEDN